MAVNFKEGSLKRISYTDILKLYCASLFWGLWLFVKDFLKIIWKRRESDFQNRGNPPPCLTDGSLGQHLYIKLKGVKLHYIEAGEKENPLILLLHGFPDFWLTWRYQIPDLAKYYRVVAVDLKGFGDSDKPESRGSYKIHLLIDEIRELIFSLGYSSCDIVGHDIGALLGWFLVHLHPECVRKFVSLATPHPNLYWESLPSSCQFNPRWMQFCQLPTFPENKALEEDIDVINKCYEYLNTNAVSKSYLDAYKYAFTRKEDWTGAINYFRNLPFWRLDCGDRETLVPCLLVVGNKDKSVSMESIIKSTEYAAKNLVKIVEGASHHLHQQRPNEVNKILISFLIGNNNTQEQTQPPSNGVFSRILNNAMSSTVKYGNNMFDVVQKKTNGITGRALNLGQSQT